MSNKNLSLFDDESIIDVTNQSYSLLQKAKFIGLKKYIPSWNLLSTFTYSAIETASENQINFYKIFKDRFYKGELTILDYRSPTYVFILLFDFINEYEKDKNLVLLKQRVFVIKKHYDVCRMYCNFFLRQILIEVGDNVGLEKLITEIKKEGDYRSLFDNDWKLGYRYKIKLKLSDHEVIHLNRLNIKNNNFTDITHCHIEIVKLYLNSYRALGRLFVQEKTSMEIAFGTVADLVARKNHRFRNGSRNYFNSIDTSMEEFVHCIFYAAENEVRKKYFIKPKSIKKLNSYHPEAKKAFETLVLQKIEISIAPYINEIEPLREEDEIALNYINVNRWKSIFENLKVNFDGNLELFCKAIDKLCIQNSKHPQIASIYLDASKFILNHDRFTALKLYLQYVYQNKITGIFKRKPIPREYTKVLFSEKSQLAQYEKIIDDLIIDKDLEKAIIAIPTIYEVVRKKINIDLDTINEVQGKHADTVNLLSEYLKDEEQDFPVKNLEKVKSKTKEEKATIPKSENQSYNNYIAEISLSEIQDNLLKMFALQEFTLSFKSVEKFAKTHGKLKNQLIESINDSCYEFLDDLLIEEEDENYTINISYYKKITTK